MPFIPETDDELHDWIKTFLGFHIPRVAVTEGFCAPFDLASDLFFRRIKRALVLAARGTGKTTLFAISNLIRSKFSIRCGTGHFAAVEAQGDQGMGYLRLFLEKPYLAKDIEKNIAGYVEWKNKSWVRRGSGYGTKSVTAAHTNRLIVDEVDLWTPEQFETAMFMVTGTRDNPPETVLGSTAYDAGGMMHTTLLPQAKRRRYKTYKWGAFESMERCEECRGKKCPLYEWENPRTGKQERLCRDRALRSDGFITYENAIDEYFRADSETYLVQKLLESPGRRGLIYPTFNPTIHAPGPPPKEVWQFGTVGIGVDWGYDHPLVFTVFVQLPNGIYWGIEEVVERFCTPSRELEIAEGLNEKHKRGNEFPTFFCGKDQPSSIQAFYEAGLAVVPSLVTLREDGHRYIRRILDVNKGPLLFLDPDEMPGTVHQLGSIHKDNKGKEIRKDDDCADSARNVLASAVYAGGMSIGGGFTA